MERKKNQASHFLSLVRSSALPLVVLLVALRAPARADTLDFALMTRGPHHVTQGHYMFMLVVGTVTAGTDEQATPSVSGLPAGAVASYPDQVRFCCGTTIYRIGETNPVQITAASNTAPGTYPLTITYTSASGVVRSVPYDLVVDEVPAPITKVPFPADVPLSSLAQWESNMSVYGAKHCDPVEETGGAYQGYVWYYDGIRVFHQIGDYTGDHATWDACAALVTGLYTGIIFNDNGNLPGYTVFPKGLAMNYLRFGEAVSKQALDMLRDHSSYAGGGDPAYMTDWIHSRETAYALDTHMADESISVPRKVQIFNDLVELIFGHFSQWFLDQNATYVQPFMVALSAEALIDYYQISHDPRVPPLLKLAADQLWAKSWDSVHQNFNYYLDDGSVDSPSQDLNLLIAPLFGWVYQQTGQQQYRDEGDMIFNAGVAGAYLGEVGTAGKQFSQNYRWSEKYIEWRKSVLPPPVTPPLPILPLPPQSTVDTTYTPSTCTVTVSNGGDLQAAIDAAQLGDTVCLTPGATFSGNFILKNKATGSGWITLRTATPDSQFVQPGIRVAPTDAAKMPKIIGMAAGGAFAAENAAHHYRLIGLELTRNPADSINYNVLVFGDASVTDPALLPHHLIADRCYIHGTPVTQDKRGVAMNGAYEAVIDSYISDFHLEGQDAQAIQGHNGPGPYKIVNNYLEGAGENVMFGGAFPAAITFIPSDIEIRHNYFFKPLSWKVGDPSYAGIHWTVKNLFELKDAQRVLLDGNIFENNWIDAQVGFGILLNGIDGPTTTIHDITFTHNIVRNTPSGFNVCANCTNPQLTPTNTVLLQDNLFENISDIYFQVLGLVDNMTFNHNTGTDNGKSYATLIADGAQDAANFVFQNNIAGHGLHGVSGSGMGEGTSALTAYFPGYVFLKNVVANMPQDGTANGYPLNSYYPADWSSVAFLNFNNGSGGDYHLAPTSPYKSAATDGKDIGADIDAVLAATGGVKEGTPGSPSNPNPTTTVGSGNFSPLVYPNPWRSDKHIGKKISFSRLVVGGTIKIFTISGHKVKEIPAASTTMTWDLTNDGGDKVASGIYVYLITDGQGNKAKGKVAVIK